ncbi:MAG TPA: phosphotransferase [Phenylobacterium sp.]|jgi:hypothetical protein|nr:phosphotransferase [Phenylobacterium sp.]
MDEPRHEVLWFGEAPTAQAVREFANRRLTIASIGDNAPLPPLPGVAGAIFAFPKRDREGLFAAAAAHARTFVDYGARVELIAPDDATTGRVQARLGAALALPNVSVRTSPRGFEIAEAAARHDAGYKPRTDLEIVVAGNREPIRKVDEPLFQRAFQHCRRIALVELTGGRSDARVFAVHMTVDRSDAGVWPQPAFAKLDRNDKIAREFQNYRDFADKFIPFGLRPNVQDVVVGGERSLLVGNFVDRSESLWDLARRKLAATAVTALIDETLGGWRDQAYASDPAHGSVARAMIGAGLSKPNLIRPRYAEVARDQGVTITPDALWDKLLGLQQRYRVAPVHGDLHGENVRVRNGQAILIDLASVARGPLTADLAALETWLAFELPPERPEDQYEDCAWREEIRRLYAPAAFQHPPGPCDPTSNLGWMSTVVRQIRHMGIAAQSCPTEYQTAVAVQLLRRCQWDDGPPADRYRRGVGYVVAAALTEDAQHRSPSI